MQIPHNCRTLTQTVSEDQNFQSSVFFLHVGPFRFCGIRCASFHIPAVFPGSIQHSCLHLPCLRSRLRRRQWHPTPVLFLENPMDRGAWWATVHGVAKSRTRLSDFTFTFHFHALEKAMATHSSVLAWRIPGTGEPGGLLSMGSHRVGTRLKRLSSSCSSRSRLKGNKYLFNKSV